MRLIDADKLHREKIDNIICYSVQQIANAPTVCDIEQIRAEIEKWAEDPCVMNHGCGDEVLRIIDKYTKGDTDV